MNGDFSERELYLMSEGILAMLRDSGESYRRIPDAEVKRGIAAYMAALKALHRKITRVMNGGDEP